VKANGIDEVKTVPASPWQNSYCERVIGSLRRECTDHIIPLSEKQLLRVLKEYVAYHNASRTHLSLEKTRRNIEHHKPRMMAIKSYPSPYSVDCITDTSAFTPKKTPRNFKQQQHFMRCIFHAIMKQDSCACMPKKATSAQISSFRHLMLQFSTRYSKNQYL
jgi:hypothetical protein